MDTLPKAMVITRNVLTASLSGGMNDSTIKLNAYRSKPRVIKQLFLMRCLHGQP